MTVETSTRYTLAHGNGVATVFPFNFPVRRIGDLKVTRRWLVTGAEVVLTTNDFTYTGVGRNSLNGSITYQMNGAPISSDYDILIERVVPYTQDLDIKNQDGFYPETLEEQLDLIVMMIQQNLDNMARAVLVPSDESPVTIPNIEDRKGKFLFFNPITGDPEATIVGVSLPSGVEYTTRLVAEALPLPVIVPRIRVMGYSVVGDGGAAAYKLTSDPLSPAGFTDAAGNDWELDERELDDRMMGVHLSAAAAESALQDFVDAAAQLNIPAVIHAGASYTCPAGTIELPEGIRLYMHGATIIRSVDLTIPLFQCVGTALVFKNRGVIEGGTLKYTAATTNTGITNSTALWLKFGRNWHVRNVRIEGAFYIGFRFDDMLDCSLSDFWCYGLYNRAVYVAATSYTENVFVRDGVCDGYQYGTTTRLTNHIVNCNVYGTGTGRNITFTNIYASHCSVSPSGEGFAVGDRLYNVKYVNCHAYDCNSGFIASYANGFSGGQVNYANCTAHNCPRGYYVLGANQITFIGCHSYNHSIAGFEVTTSTNASTQIIIDSSIISGDATTAGGSGVRISGTGTGLVMVNSCMITNNLGYGVESTAAQSFIGGRGNIVTLNGTETNILGLSNLDFSTAAGSGNIVV